MFIAPISKKDTWNPCFYKDNPLFSSILPLWLQVQANFESDWPRPEDFNVIAQAYLQEYRRDNNLKFIDQITPAYVETIFNEGAIPTRIHCWHDFFNNLSWILWPKMKWAIIQKLMIGTCLGTVRTPQQNLLAHFDECGVILCSDKPELLEDIKQFRWKQFFWENPSILQHCLPIIIGHGILEKVSQPYIGMTGKAILLQVPTSFFSFSYQDKMRFMDLKLADYILSEAFPQSPQSLQPFPFLGWPGWHPQNQFEYFYDNEAYFRPKRRTKCEIAIVV